LAFRSITSADVQTVGPGIAPLALLTNEVESDLPAAFERFHTQLRVEAMSGKMLECLLGSTFVLCGIRYQPEQIEELYRI
jgi:hypothetical protein